ncbi:hypothetical protein HC776_03125 [bacterium]|nr:hypothetical protein [bacterium]
MTKKIILNVTDEMHEALQKISKTEDKVVSGIIRRLISEYLTKEYGIELTQTIQLGGSRRENSE